MLIYTPKRKFWPVIDDALRTAAIDNQIQIKMLISYWNHSSPSEDNFLKSLSSLSNVYKRVSIEVVCIKRFLIGLAFSIVFKLCHNCNESWGRKIFLKSIRILHIFQKKYLE